MSGRAMDLIKQYPFIFALTVIMPVIAGFVTAVIGWDNLVSRAKNEAHRAKVESQLSQINERLGPLNDQLTMIRVYEKVLAQANERDQVLSAVLAQYERMKLAAEAFDRLRNQAPVSESEELAQSMLSIIRADLTPIHIDPALPSRPLIMKIGANTYRVLFSVPMRIPPALQFTGIPQGSTATVLEISRFGFTVVFAPLSFPVEQFGFTADAEL